MNLPCKIHKAVGDERGRYAMQAVAYDPAGFGVLQGPALAATNGCLLAIVACESEHPTAQLVPQEACAAAWKNAKRGVPAALELGASAALDAKDARMVFRPVVGEFPKVAALVPTGPHAFRVQFSAYYLAQLVEALGSSTGAVELEFRLGTGPIAVFPVSDLGNRLDGRIGALLPITSGATAGTVKGDAP